MPLTPAPFASVVDRNPPQPTSTDRTPLTSARRADMDPRPWAPEAPLRCLHSGQPPTAQKPDDAGATFMQCAQTHTLPAAMESLRVEADKLRALQARIEQTQADEMGKREHLQKHIRAVFELLENARDTINAPLPRAAPSELTVQHPGAGNAAQSEAVSHPMAMSEAISHPAEASRGPESQAPESQAAPVEERAKFDSVGYSDDEED